MYDLVTGHPGQVSLNRTLIRVLIAVTIVFISNIIIFTIFDPRFHRRRRQPMRINDCLSILYMAILGTMGTIFVLLLYVAIYK